MQLDHRLPLNNDFDNHVPYSDYLAAFSQARIPVRWPGAIPNLQPPWSRNRAMRNGQMLRGERASAVNPTLEILVGKDPFIAPLQVRRPSRFAYHAGGRRARTRTPQIGGIFGAKAHHCSFLHCGARTSRHLDNEHVVDLNQSHAESTGL